MDPCDSAMAALASGDGIDEGSDSPNAQQHHHLSPPRSDDGASVASEGGVASPDMLGLLRILAETQRDIFSVMQRGELLGLGRSRVLASVRLPDVDGCTQTTVRKYRERRKGVQTIRELNQLSDKELAFIVFSQASGRA